MADLLSMLTLRELRQPHDFDGVLLLCRRLGACYEERCVWELGPRASEAVFYDVETASAPASVDVSEAVVRSAAACAQVVRLGSASPGDCVWSRDGVVSGSVSHN